MTKLPEGWAPESLSDVCLPVTKADPVSTGRQQVLYVDIGSVDGARHRLPEILWIDSESAPSRCRQIIASGDTVFSTVRPYLEKIAFIDGSLDGEFASTGFCVLRPGPQLLPRYLFHFSVSHQMLDQVLIHQRGVSYPAVLGKDVKTATIPLPPLDEQRRIVDILEDHLSRLDAAEASLAMARLRNEGLVTAALLGEVQVQTAPTAPLSALLAEPLANGRSVPTREGGFPVLRLTALRTSEVNLSQRKAGAWTETEARPYLVRRGDFLVSRGNGSLRLVARGAYVTQEPDAVAYPDTLIRVRTRPEDIDPGYMTLVWNSPIVRRQIESMARTTAGIYKVNQKQLESVKVPVPSLDAQRVLGVRVGAIAAAGSRLGGELKLAEERSQGLRRALLAVAFSGRLIGRSTDMEMVEEMALV